MQRTVHVLVPLSIGGENYVVLPERENSVAMMAEFIHINCGYIYVHIHFLQYAHVYIQCIMYMRFCTFTSCVT